MILLSISGTPLEIGRVLYGALAAILLLFGAELFDRYLRADKRTRKDAAYILFLMLSLGIMAYAVYMVFAIIIDLFAEYVREYRVWLNPLRFTMVIFIIGSFAVVAEIILSGKKKKKIPITGVILLLGGIVGITQTVLSAQGNSISALDYLILAVIGLFALYGFYALFYIFLKQMAPQKEIKKKILFGLLAAIIAFGGEGIQLVYDDNGELWIVGVIVEIVGWLVIRHFFLSIPSYGEFEWKTGMIELHVIIAETGISLYYRRFNVLDKNAFQGDVEIKMRVKKENAPRPSTDLVAGGLVGIKGMLREISGDTGNLENIEIGEKSLIFKQGKVVMALLLADKNLGVYHAILEDLVKTIEKEHPNLENFNGDTRNLNIAPIVEDKFGLEPEN